VIAGANIAGMTTFACYFGFQFIATLYMQQLLGWSALETALAFLPAGLLVAFGAPRMGPLATRIGTAPLITAGLLSFVVGYALFVRIDVTPEYALAILPTILLLGLGFALTYPAANMAATSGVPDHEQGLASGLVNTSFQLGGAVGLAIVTAVITAGRESATDPSSLLDEFRPGLAVVTGFAVLGLSTVLASLLAQRRLERRLAIA
jgi:MFS family permease